MYKIIKIFSYLTRQFLLPNPFTNLFIDKNVAEIVNWIFGSILVPLSYGLTGTWYDGEFRAIGSIEFLINYALLTAIFLLITYYIKNIYFSIGIFIIVYTLLCFLENTLLRKKYFFKYNTHMRASK